MRPPRHQGARTNDGKRPPPGPETERDRALVGVSPVSRTLASYGAPEDGRPSHHSDDAILRRHVISRRSRPTASAAMKKNANVTNAERSAIMDALPRNDQFRLYSPYEITKAQAAAITPNTRPRTALSWRFTASERLRLAGGGVPPEDPVLLHRFEREQAGQRRVVADLHGRGGLAVLRLEAIEEVAGVHVQRVVLFDRTARVDVDVQVHRRLSTSPPSPPARAARAARASAAAAP